MFEIWRHRGSGERFLVVVRDGQVNVAAGPLLSDDEPREVLETHGNQAHNPPGAVEHAACTWGLREGVHDQSARAGRTGGAVGLTGYRAECRPARVGECGRRGSPGNWRFGRLADFPAAGNRPEPSADSPKQ